jgi:FkbM family methyltransferase
MLQGDYREFIRRNYLEMSNDSSILESAENESEIISQQIRKHKISTYIDIGCWYGFLLKNVMLKNMNINTIAIDAIPAFTKIAKSNCPSKKASFFTYAIVPSSTYENEDFNLNLSDSSKSGFESAGFRIPGLRRITLSDWIAEECSINVINNSYLKIDLEGLDFNILRSTLSKDVHPIVIHFEVVNRRKFEYPNISSFLKLLGYKIMALPSNEHAFYSVICSKSECIIIGFRPFKCYPDVN